MNSALLYLDISKTYSEFKVDVELEINQGEFFSLIGPSGCGKTTLLRLITGLEKPDQGYIHLEGKDITMLTPAKRNIGFLFQEFALFPHMNVTENIEYGLKVRKLPKSQREKRTKEMLALFEIETVARRPVDQLSGGEKQRVALARALAPEPAILLLDEPFSAIDHNLRLRLRQELKQLQQKLQFTTIFVTHQQEEALALSDRMAVMQNGLILQQGAPYEIYHNPDSLFVAEFLGNANLIPCRVENSADALHVYPSGMKDFKLPCANIPSGGYQLMIRPEDFFLGNPETAIISGEITALAFYGYLYHLEINTGYRYISAFISKEIPGLKRGDKIYLSINYQNIRLIKE